MRNVSVAAVGLIPIMNVENACAGGVQGARLGLTENGGGFIGTGEAAIAIHILEGPA